jgi:hypothetical protein
MNESIVEYIALAKKVKDLQKEMKDYKQALVTLEPSVREYMNSKSTDAITFQGYTVMLYTKTTKKKPNKEEVKERLQEEVGSQRAEELLKTIHEPTEEFSEDKLKLVIPRS